MECFFFRRHLWLQPVRRVDFIISGLDGGRLGGARWWALSSGPGPRGRHAGFRIVGIDNLLGDIDGGIRPQHHRGLVLFAADEYQRIAVSFAYAW